MVKIGRLAGLAIMTAMIAVPALTLTGCSGGSELKSFLSRQVHSVVDHQDEIPLPKVVAGGNRIPVTQSTYCWGNRGCADYAGGIVMVRDKAPAAVAPEAAIEVTVPYKQAPSKLELVEYFEEGKFVEIPLKEGRFHAPKEPGVYYYGISAFWTTADGKFSKGDTSVVFSIEVKP